MYVKLVHCILEIAMYWHDSMAIIEIAYTCCEGTSNIIRIAYVVMFCQFVVYANVCRRQNEQAAWKPMSNARFGRLRC